MFKTTQIGVAGARVLAFRGTGLCPEFSSGAQVLVVDRRDGMGNFFLARRAVRLTQKFREGSLDVIIETYETKVGPRNGAKVVAKAWVDEDYAAHLKQGLLTYMQK